MKRHHDFIVKQIGLLAAFIMLLSGAARAEAQFSLEALQEEILSEFYEALAEDTEAPVAAGPEAEQVIEETEQVVEEPEETKEEPETLIEEPEEVVEAPEEDELLTDADEELEQAEDASEDLMADEMPMLNALSLPSDYITSLTVDKSYVDAYGKVRVDLAFSDGGEQVFHAGDVITVSFEGEASLRPFSKTVPLVSSEGVTYATAYVTSTGVTIEFNDQVEQVYDVTGSLWFEAIAVNETDQNQTVTITSGSKSADVTVGPGKGDSGGVGELPDQRKLAAEYNGYDGAHGIDPDVGDYLMWLNSDDPTYCLWSITFNENEQSGFGSSVTITDSVGSGQTMDWSYMLIYGSNPTISGTVSEVIAEFEARYPGSTLSVSSSGEITWTIGREYVDGVYWHLMYRTNITDFSLEKYTNFARFSFTDQNGNRNVVVDGAGYENLKSGETIVAAPRGVVRVTKKVGNTDVTLPGVTWALDKQNASGGWERVGEMITDENGVAQMSKLKTGHYRLYETEAPAYVTMRYTEEDPYEFDLDTSVAEQQGLDATLRDDVQKVDIEATKEWQNEDGSENMDDHPTIYLQLYRKAQNGNVTVKVGSPKALADGETKVVWEQLPKTDVFGNPYVYSVREVDADGNDATPDGYHKLEDGLTVVNTAGTQSAEVVIRGRKELKGADIAAYAGSFAFSIEALNGAPLHINETTVYNDADGGFGFGPLTFSRSDLPSGVSEKTYWYVIREVMPKNADPETRMSNGIVYDDAFYSVPVVVSMKDGTLTASIDAAGILVSALPTD